MNKIFEPIVSLLDNNSCKIDESDFIEIQYDIVDKLKTKKLGFEIVRNVLELMEEYPLVEFGTPGPLTHFIESFYKENQELYEEQLKQSIERSPTVHTVWLLNRIINGSQGEKYLELMVTMNSICDDDKLHEGIRNIAKYFSESHDDSEYK